MTDEKWRTAVDLLQTMGPTSYIGDPLLWDFVVAKLCTICLDYGNPADAVPSYAALGMLFVTRRDNFELADDLCWLALSLSERYGVPLSARLTIGTCLRHWCPASGSIRHGADDLLEAYEMCMKANALQHAAYCLANYSIHVFYGGLGAKALRRFVDVNLSFCKEKQNHWAVLVLEGVGLALRLVVDGSVDDAEYCDKSAGSSQTLATYRTARARALLLRGDARAAHEACELVQQDVVFVEATGSLAGAEHVFNRAMAAAGVLWQTPDDAAAQAALAEAEARLALWGAGAPGTFGARAALVRAERAALSSGDEDGDCWAALRQCAAAARRAEHDEKCLPVAALAHMSAARLCRARPEELGVYAAAHDAEVRRVMAVWGKSSSFAPAPEAACDEPVEAEPEPEAELTVDTGETGETGEPGEPADEIEPLALPSPQLRPQSAATAAAAEEEQDDERERIQADVLMPVLLQATGADHGLLLQQQGDDDVWTVRARARVAGGGGGEDVHVEQASEPVTATTAPMSLVREAARLRTSLALGDTREPHHPYVSDPYWAAAAAGGLGTRAALCLPLAAAGSTSTVVLLENSLTPDVFTDESIRAARALAQQVAVSMGLYSNYADVYERTKAGLLRVLPSGAILSANPAARRLLGPDAEELKFVEGRDRKDWLSSVRATDGTSVSDFEAQVVGADGECVWVSIQTSALRDLHGGVRVLEVALQDISVAKERAELELQRQAAKSKFLSVVAHEVRTPMNAIMCTTEVALASATDEAHLETLRSIRVAGNHLLSLLNEVLDHNKAEEGKLDLMATPFELRRVASDIMSITECNTMHSSVKLGTDIAPDVPDLLVGDGKRLGQCLLNLLSNASKFTTQGSITLAARLLGRGDGTARVRFEVRDTGPGISADQLERVFEPYVQASARTWRNHGGTGLGLSIVRQIVTLMGGQLGVSSDGVGLGSTFWFEVELPVASVEALEAARQEDLSGGVTAQRLLPAEQRAAMRVLIVDDSRMNVKVARMLCKSIGFTLTEMALDGREALERIAAPVSDEAPPIDVVLMDLNMPVMDGVEATRELRARGFTLPVIGVTAASEQSDVEMCLQSGMDTVAIKPLERARIEEALVEVLVRDR